MAACIGLQIPELLKAILPLSDEAVRTHLCSFTPLDDNGTFEASLRISTKSKEEWTQWLESFKSVSKVTWRVKSTYPSTGAAVIFRTYYRCQHGQQRQRKDGSSSHSKDTNCQSLMKVYMRRTANLTRNRKSRSTDVHLPEYPTWIYLSWVHNHAIEIPAAIKYRDVGEEVIGKLTEMFENGHSPSSALAMLQVDIQLSDPEGYITKVADRALCPDLQFCYRLYYKIFRKVYGPADGDKMLAAIDERIAPYNAENGPTCAKMSKTISGHLILAICTPLMQRVHDLRHSGELCFIASTGNVDRHGTVSRIFLLLTHSSAGGLPLGVLITSSEQQDVIEEGLALLRTVMPPNAFSGRGQAGPAAFITDDSAGERNALNSVYPDATLLLCTYHVLQAAWRWLWDGKHGIPKHDRQALFGYIKQMMWDSSSEDATREKLSSALEDPTVRRYPKYVDYLKNLYERRYAWVLPYRFNLLVRGNNPDNYAEAAMRVLKDTILHRAKAFNIPQLVDFTLKHMAAYYRHKLIGIVNQRPLVVSDRYSCCSSPLKKDGITQFLKTGETYHVKSSAKSCHANYVVDMSLGICTCPVGLTGGPCKHQAAVAVHFNLASDNMLPTTTAEERAVLLKIATGQDGEKTIQLQDGLRDMFQAISTKLQDNPETFSEPVGAMLRSFNTLKTDDSLLTSAMCMFGVNLGKREITTSSARVSRRGPSIDVQPAAVARRKAAAPGGRKRPTAGRPTKRAATAEHGNSQKRKQQTSQRQPKRARVTAPDSMADAVCNNVSLGETHSRTRVTALKTENFFSCA